MRRRRKIEREKRDFDALERRRLEGAKLLKEGLNNSQIAHNFGVSRDAVMKWKRLLKKRSSLLKRRSGQKPVMRTKKQLAILRDEIKNRPEDCFPVEYFIRTEVGLSPSYKVGDFRKFKDGRWTGPLLVSLIEEKLEIRPPSRPTAKKILNKILNGRM